MAVEENENENENERRKKRKKGKGRMKKRSVDGMRINFLRLVLILDPLSHLTAFI